MNHERLNDLFKDFRTKHPKIDYFNQEIIFQYMRMAFHIGYDAKKHNINPKPLIRSDGKHYKSLNIACIDNNTDHSTIKRAIRDGIKHRGFYWEFANQ